MDGKDLIGIGFEKNILYQGKPFEECLYIYTGINCYIVFEDDMSVTICGSKGDYENFGGITPSKKQFTKIQQVKLLITLIDGKRW
jgi:hypothetical protein